ncbi:MAG: DNA topoisomerase IV subunit B, partial [Neisseriaceae bacterium]|nr:DNA topoisomerase IV subunit B [Neisseriaceae bacterium]
MNKQNWLDRSYDEASVTVLKGLEPVKKRPGMYTYTDNPTHICQEVIDNAADEALGGFADQITVDVFSDLSLQVED